jgi:hypothetical protein
VNPLSSWNSKTLAKTQKATKQINALASVLQVVDRAISGDINLTVKLTNNKHAPPAWTDGQTIFLNGNRVREIFEDQPDLARAILTFKGTNYHELAHVLFTPRPGDTISEWIKANKYTYKWVWNALEDQRIETLYTNLYPPTVPYFQNSSYRWLLENSDGDNFYRVYSLIAGRKYIDAKVRASARAAFAEHYGEDVAVQWDTIVDTYVKLPLPGKSDEAIVLIKAAYDLLRAQEDNALENYVAKEGKCDDDSERIEKGETDPDKIVEGVVREEERQEREQGQDDSASSGGYPEDDNHTGPQTPGSHNQEASEEASESPVEGAQGSAAGTGDSQPVENLEEALREAATEALADVLADDDFQKEIAASIEAFRAHMDHTGEEALQAEYKSYNEVDAQPETLQTVAKIVASIKALRTDFEPKWSRDREAGPRINIDAVIRNRCDATRLDIFEVFDEGAIEEASTEVVIAFDLSTSMDGVLPQCSQALWLLKKSFDNLDIPCTVLGFSSGNTVLYKASEKLRGIKVRQFKSWAGTQPRQTLLYAHRLLTKSQATNKVLIAITDGIWSQGDDDGGRPENVIKSLRQAGTQTLLFGVNGHVLRDDERYCHGFEQTASINDVTDLVKVVKGLIRGIQEKAREKVAR